MEKTKASSQRNAQDDFKTDIKVFTVFSVFYRDGKSYNHLHLSLAKDLAEAHSNAIASVIEKQGPYDDVAHLYYTSLDVSGLLSKVGFTKEERAKRHSELMRHLIAVKDLDLIEKVKPVLNEYELKYINSNLCEKEKENRCSLKEELSVK